MIPQISRNCIISFSIANAGETIVLQKKARYTKHTIRKETVSQSMKKICRK